jgi:uncharacterized protein
MRKSFYPTLGQALLLIPIALLLSLPAIIPTYIIEEINATAQLSWLPSLGTFISYAFSFLMLIWYAKRNVRHQGKWKIDWKMNKVEGKFLLVLLLMVPALMVLITPIAELIPMPAFVEEFFKGMIKPDFFSMLTIVVMAPVLEEVLFRGIVLQGFRKNYSAPKAVFWSAVVFALIHLNPWQALPAFILGLFIGWAYLKTNSLIPAILIHFTNNLTASVLSFIFGEQESTIDLFGLTNYILAAITSVLILIAGYVYISRNHKEEEPQEISEEVEKVLVEA